jgi:BMFP domain-containing protein YqiC
MITKEGLQKLEFITGEDIDLVYQLLRERDAYRALAIRMVDLDNTNIDDVDLEVQRILKGKA